MASSVDLLAVFPILAVGPPWIVDAAEDLRAEAYRVATELSALEAGLRLPALDDLGTYTASLTIASHHDDRFPRPTGRRGVSYLGRPKERSPRSWLVASLKVALTLEVREPVYRVSGDGREELSEEETLDFMRFESGEAMARTVFDLCASANLAAPGAVDLGAPFVYRDGALATTGVTTISSLELARRYVRKTGWPPIRALSFSDVWDWVGRLDLTRRVGDSPVSRAYNAWTYQFGAPGRDDPATLFWALMGVEALYNDGREGVKESVIRRSELLLGTRQARKSDFGDMYRVRSAFVHGGLPFPAKDFPYEGMEQYEAYVTKVGEATSVAQAILAASLQEIIARDWSALEFDTLLRGVPAGQGRSSGT